MPAFLAAFPEVLGGMLNDETANKNFTIYVATPDQAPDHALIPVADWSLSTGPDREYRLNSEFSVREIHCYYTYNSPSCQDAVKEERLRESQSPVAPGLDSSSPSDVSTVFSARATMPSV